MNLRAAAAADAKAFLEDVDGFAWDITVTAPNGTTAVLKGFTTDIGLAIDPETGTAVTSRRAGVALPIRALDAAGLGLPQAVADPKKRPWVVSFKDPDDREQTFKVTGTAPDRTLGIVTCSLEAYYPQD